MIKTLLVVLNLTLFSSLSFASEIEISKPIYFYLDLEKLSAPLSFYTDQWNPKEELPLIVDGKRVEEKDLVVNSDELNKKNREEQDLIRMQNSSLFESHPWVPYVESKEEYWEVIESDETQCE